jgi:hypothetical protein
MALQGNRKGEKVSTLTTGQMVRLAPCNHMHRVTSIEPHTTGAMLRCDKCGCLREQSPDQPETRIISDELQEIIDNPAWTGSNPYFSEETVTYYHGTASLHYPITDPENDMYGGSYVEYVTCPHMHTDYEAAQECGRRLAAREARKRNADAKNQRAADHVAEAAGLNELLRGSA